MTLRLNAELRTTTVPRPGMPVPDLGRAGAPGPNGSPRLLIFASLFCADCLELLSHLAPVAAAIPEYRLLLLAAGDPKEVREMSEYFGWTFETFPVNVREMHEGMGVRVYPYAIFDIGDGKIARAGTVHNEHEILALAAGLLMKGGETHGLHMPDGIHA